MSGLPRCSTCQDGGQDADEHGVEAAGDDKQARRATIAGGITEAVVAELIANAGSGIVFDVQSSGVSSSRVPD